MSQENFPETLGQIIAAILERARTDQNFRRLALQDSKAAVEKIGKTSPAGLELRFVENKPGQLSVVLPATQSSPDELTEEELGHVAGGCSVSCGLSCSDVTIQ